MFCESGENFEILFLFRNRRNGVNRTHPKSNGPPAFSSGFLEEQGASANNLIIYVFFLTSCSTVLNISKIVSRQKQDQSDAHQRHQRQQSQAKDEDLQDVDSFTNLESVITKGGGTDKDIQTRVGKARTAFLL